MRRKVFVSNLSFRANETQIAKFFELAGSVRSVQVARTPEGESRGCAVIEFDSDDNADIAIDVFDGRQLLGRTLSVRAFRETPAQRVGSQPEDRDVDPRRANGHRRQAHEHVRRGELHDKAQEDWRRLRGSKRRI